MMDTRMVRSAAVALLLLAAPTAMHAQQAAGMPGPPLTLERLEQMAFDNNPTLRQAQAQINAARGRASQAGAWPNPVIGYSGEEIGFADDPPGGRHGVFVEQTVPLGASCDWAAASLSRR